MTLAWILLFGCANPCDLVGTLAGLYDGDAAGDLTLDVTESEKDPGQLDVNATLGDPLSAVGYASLSCDPEAGLDLTLTDTSGEAVGEILGTLGAEAASGTWTTLDGLAGTWSAARAE